MSTVISISDPLSRRFRVWSLVSAFVPFLVVPVSFVGSGSLDVVPVVLLLAALIWPFSIVFGTWNHVVAIDAESRTVSEIYRCVGLQRIRKFTFDAHSTVSCRRVGSVGYCVQLSITGVVIRLHDFDRPSGHEAARRLTEAMA